MAIVSQQIPIIIRGLNEKKDDAVSLPGELVVAQNVEQTSTGALKPRNGTTKVGSFDPSSSELIFSRGSALRSHGVYPSSYARNSNQWISSSSVRAGAADVFDVFSSVSSVTAGGGVYVNGFVYTSTPEGGTHAYRYGTSEIVYSAQTTVIGDRAARVGTAGTKAVFFRQVGNTLSATTVEPSVSSTPSLPVTVATDVAAGLNCWDVYQVPGDASGRILVAYIVNGAPSQIKVLYWTSSNAADASVGTVTHTGSGTAAVHVAIAGMRVSDGFVYLATQTNNPGVEHIRGIRLVASTLASSANAIIRTAIATFRLGVVAGVTSSPTMNVYWIAASGSGVRLDKYSYNFGTSVGSAALATDLNTAGIDGLGTRPFFLGTSCMLAVFSKTDATQPTLFIVSDLSGAPIARLMAGSAATMVVGTDASTIGSGTVVFPVTRNFRLQKNDRTFTYNRGSAVVRFSACVENVQTVPDDLGAPVSIGAGIVMPGALTAFWANTQPEEINFTKYPVILGVSVGAAAAVSHQYVLVFEWIDSGGSLHRSAPSSVWTVSNSSATPNNTITIEGMFTTARYRSTVLPNNGISAVLYRTLGGGTEFYRVSDIATPTLINESSATTISIVDTVSDTTLAGRELLYTSGGIFESMAPPASKQAVLHDGRVFLFGCERGGEVWFSKHLVTGEAPSFNDAFVINVDSSDGSGVTAGASMSDALIVFKPRSIYAVTGSGPDDLGRGGYDPPRKISDVIGTTRPRSVVTTKDGVFFQTADGQIYLLNRAFDLVHVGLQVEDTAIASVVVGGAVASTGEVKLATAGGKVLVYDPQHGQWYVHEYTGKTFSSACSWEGSLTLQMPVSSVLKETAGTYTDNGTAITAKIRTSPIALAGVENLQRVREIIVHGVAASGGTVVTVRLYYDYSSTAGETFTYTTVAGRNAIRVQPKVQKCAAIAIEVEQTAAASSLAVSAFTMSAAVKGRPTTSGTSATPV